MRAGMRNKEFCLRGLRAPLAGLGPEQGLKPGLGLGLGIKVRVQDRAKVSGWG